MQFSHDTFIISWYLVGWSIAEQSPVRQFFSHFSKEIREIIWNIVFLHKRTLEWLFDIRRIYLTNWEKCWNWYIWIIFDWISIIDWKKSVLKYKNWVISFGFALKQLVHRLADWRWKSFCCSNSSRFIISFERCHTMRNLESVECVS